MSDRAVSPLSALIVTAVVLLAVGLYLQTMHATVHALLELRQLGPSLPEPPPCSWTLPELEAIAQERGLAIEVVRTDGRHRVGPHTGGGAPPQVRVSTLQIRHRCEQVLLTVRGAA
ncbi:MAG: hypothetical protein RI544_00430 [Haloquadratum sp.]|jgi:hypothetical protein|nr:hypothetical protein [Haloferacaceae archaeon]MDR9444609.1 hypothetical protein [Haloquadratum sp.]